MTALLIIHGLLVLLAIKRGWRVAPFVILALPRLFAEFGPALPELALAGWFIPFTTLTLFVGLGATCCLIYTAIAEPERA